MPTNTKKSRTLAVTRCHLQSRLQSRIPVVGCRGSEGLGVLATRGERGLQRCALRGELAAQARALLRVRAELPLRVLRGRELRAHRGLQLSAPDLTGELLLLLSVLYESSCS